MNQKVNINELVEAINFLNSRLPLGREDTDWLSRVSVFLLLDQLGIETYGDYDIEMDRKQRGIK